MNWAEHTANEKREVVRELVVAQGKTYAEVADILGATRDSIAGVVKRSLRTADPIRFPEGPEKLTRWQRLTPEQKQEEVRELVAGQGLTYSGAAELLGCSRVAIAGVVERSLRSPKPIRSSSGLKNQKGVKGAAGGGRTAKTKAAKKARARAKPKHAGFHKFVALAIPEDAIERTPARQDVWEALPGSTPVPIADHHDGCRWPVGPDLPFCYCNEAVTGDKVYCAAHAAIAYREPPIKSKDRTDAFFTTKQILARPMTAGVEKDE